MWRLRKRAKDNKHPYYTDLRHCIMYECGTSPATYKANRKALKLLGWIVAYNKKRFTITDKDLTEG